MYFVVEVGGRVGIGKGGCIGILAGGGCLLLCMCMGDLLCGYYFAACLDGDDVRLG